jgi:drug/metabolite transporter (DMT)-like permease
MPLGLALVAAVGWGASDYFGGEASRHDIPPLSVLAVAEVFGLALLAPALVARGAPASLSPDLLLAALAGLAVTVELSLIYRALSRGQAFITAPTGALGASVAVGVGLIGGERLGGILGLGLLCALVGGGISAWTPSPGDGRDSAAVWRNAPVCLVAAAAVGIMLSSLHAAGRVDPYWATATEHASTCLSAALAAALAGRRSPRDLRPRRAQLPALALIAAVGVSGDLAYVGASHHGALSVVSAVSSLYPVTTIVLGRLLRGHRATRIQILGISLALAGAAVLGAASG